MGLYRSIEASVIELVQDRRIWRAITELADALMARGTVDEAEIRETCAKYFEPGSFSIDVPAELRERDAADAPA